MAKKKIILPKIKSKPKYTIELDEDQMYSLGGWLQENAGSLLTTAAGAALTATGLGAGAGIPMMVGGAAGLLGNAMADDPETIDYSKDNRMPRTVGKQNMTPNVMSFAKGGKMKKVMDEWDKGQLNIGRSGKKVPHTKKGQKQAIAIALSYKDKKALGGVMYEPGKIKTAQTVGKNVRSPLTDANVLDKFIEYGYHNDRDALSKMSPEEWQSLVPEGSPISYEKVKKGTANQGGIKWYDTQRVITGTDIYEGKDKIMTNPTKEYIGENFPTHKIYALGGEMDNNLIQLKGPKHNEGGIQFTPDSELEGGESVYKDVVNSDQIKITKQIVTKYGLPKTAINKTPAEYSDMIEKTYKGREVDPFAQTSKEMELNNLAKMSSELGEMYNKKMAKGGTLNTEDPDKKYFDQYGRFNPDLYLKDILINDNPESINSKYYTEGTGPLPTLFKGISNSKDKVEPFTIYNPGPLRKPIEENTNSPLVKPDTTPFAEGQLLNIKDPQKINRTGNPWNAFNAPKLGNYDLAKGDANKLRPNKISLPDVAESITDTNKFKGTDLLGLAPLAIGAFQAARTAAEGADKVKLGRVHAEDYNPEFIDPQYQLNQVGDTFATGNEQMNQVSRKDYLRRRIQSATEESKVKSGVLGQVNAANTQMLNQSRQINNQNRQRADEINLGVGMQEENINAANKGAWQTARDYQLSNLASMAGEIGRDRRLEDANDVYNERMFGAMKNLYPGQTYDPATGQWLNTGAPLATQDTSSINTNSSINNWQYSNDNVYGDNVELGQGLNSYPNQVNRMVNGYRLPGINLNRTYTGR